MANLKIHLTDLEIHRTHHTHALVNLKIHLTDFEIDRTHYTRALANLEMDHTLFTRALADLTGASVHRTRAPYHYNQALAIPGTLQAITGSYANLQVDTGTRPDRLKTLPISMNPEQVELHFLHTVIWRKKISLVGHIIPGRTKNA